MPYLTSLQEEIALHTLSEIGGLPDRNSGTALWIALVSIARLCKQSNISNIPGSVLPPEDATWTSYQSRPMLRASHGQSMVCALGQKSLCALHHRLRL